MGFLPKYHDLDFVKRRRVEGVKNMGAGRVHGGRGVLAFHKSNKTLKIGLFKLSS